MSNARLSSHGYRRDLFYAALAIYIIKNTSKTSSGGRWNETIRRSEKRHIHGAGYIGGNGFDNGLWMEGMMETKLTPEMMETMSLKDIFEYRLKENRHEDQLPELRRLWAAMEAERKEAGQKPGWWARLWARLK